MGMCFFFGGINRMEQHFNVVVAQTAASLLALAVGSLIIPTAFNQWSGTCELPFPVVPLFSYTDHLIQPTRTKPLPSPEEPVSSF
jgi:Ca2+/H+ antiporter